MSKDKRKKLAGGYHHSDAVRALEAFPGRRTPPPPLGDKRPSTQMIPKGAIGLVHGNAAVVPDLLDVEFEVWPNVYFRVETDPNLVINA